jgi:hypothetical protein
MPANIIRKDLSEEQQDRYLDIVRRHYGLLHGLVTDKEMLVHLWLRVGELTTEKSFIENPDTSGGQRSYPSNRGEY